MLVFCVPAYPLTLAHIEFVFTPQRLAEMLSNFARSDFMSNLSSSHGRMQHFKRSRTIDVFMFMRFGGRDLTCARVCRPYESNPLRHDFVLTFYLESVLLQGIV